jgi:transposase-like protein
MIKRMQHWFGEQVQDVPDSLSVCEFDCHKSQCSLEEWLTCEKRLNWPESPTKNHRAVQEDPWPAKKKAAVVLEVLKKEHTPAEVCETHGIEDHHLQDWTAQFRKAGEHGLATQRPTKKSETDSGELEPLIALLERKVAGQMVPPASVEPVSEGRGWWLWMLIGLGVLVVSYLAFLV